MDFQELAKYLKRGNFFKFCPYTLAYSKHGWNFGRETLKKIQIFLNLASCLVNFALIAIFVFQLYFHSGQPALVALDVSLIVTLINAIYVQRMLLRDVKGNSRIFNEHIHLISGASKPTTTT